MARQALRKNTPKAMAEMTGGEYELFTSRKSFENLMVAFTNHVHGRYELSFQPKDPAPGLHQIRVRLANPGNKTVLARNVTGRAEQQTDVWRFDWFTAVVIHARLPRRAGECARSSG